MADKRAKAPSFTTGKGPFRYPKLSAVDFGTKDYPNKEGSYSVGLVAQASDPWVVDLLAQLEPLHAAAVAKGEVAFKALKVEQRKKLGALKVNPLFTETLDQDTEEPTGEIVFKFSMKASGEYQNGKKQGKFWDARPTVFAPNGRDVMIKGFRFRDRDDNETITDVHIPMKPEIWGGTVGRVSFEVGLGKDDEPGYFVAGQGMAGISLRLTAVQVIDLVEGGQRSGEDYGFGNESDDPDQETMPDETPTSSNKDF